MPPSLARLAVRAALLAALLLSGAAPPAHSAQPAPAALVRIDAARALTLNGTFQGLGAQDDSNLLWSQPNRRAGARPEADFAGFVAPRLRALRMPLARKFIDVAWFAPTPDGYRWDSTEMQGLYANLRAHKANGTRVMLTIWSIPRWLSAQPEVDRDSALGEAASFPTPGQRPDYEERWATVVVDLLRHLYGLGFDNIAYLGAPNELAHISPARLVRPFSLLREKLAAAGLAERVALFGPDAFVEELAMARAEPGLDPLLDLYDFHYYGSGPIEAGLTAALDRLAAAVAPSGKQLWLTEFGEVTAKNDDWRTLPTVAIAAMNHGAGAALMWNTQDQIYNTQNIPAWGLWEVYDTGYRLKPAYYAWQIMAGHLPPAATVYGHSCDREQCAGLRLAALGTPEGQRAIVALNLGDRPLPLRVEWAGARGPLPLYRYTLDPAAPLGPARSGLLPSYDRAFAPADLLADTLPPGALVVYSSYRPVQPPALSTGRPATASSLESADYGAALAVDGDPLTRWSSAFADGQWLAVDLGRARELREVQIQWEAAYGRAYVIELSDDGRRWRRVFSTERGAGGVETIALPPQRARHLRLLATARATEYGLSVWELTVR